MFIFKINELSLTSLGTTPRLRDNQRHEKLRKWKKKRKNFQPKVVPNNQYFCAFE